MQFNSSYTMLLILMCMSLIIIASSTSWLCIWLGLEVNLMVFIPLLVSKTNPWSSISSLKYFLVQSMSSMLLLVSIFWTLFSSNNIMISQDFLFNTSLLMKLGSAPFHLWLPSVMENLNWMNNVLIVTLQKLGPLIALSDLPILMFSTFIIITNLMVGSLGCFNQNSLCKFMAYSSINHNGWLISGMKESTEYWTYYFINYTILTSMMMLLFYLTNCFFIHQWASLPLSMTFKFYLSACLFSLSGIPPLSGFLPKWLILEKIMETSSFLIAMTMIMTSLLSLYLYLRIVFNLLFLYSLFIKWGKWKMVIFNNILYTLILQTLLLLVVFPII